MLSYRKIQKLLLKAGFPQSEGWPKEGFLLCPETTFKRKNCHTAMYKSLTGAFYVAWLPKPLEAWAYDPLIETLEDRQQKQIDKIVRKQQEMWKILEPIYALRKNGKYDCANILILAEKENV